MLSQLQESVWHRRCPDGGTTKLGQHYRQINAMIKTETVLSQMSRLGKCFALIEWQLPRSEF